VPPSNIHSILAVILCDDQKRQVSVLLDPLSKKCLVCHAIQHTPYPILVCDENERVAVAEVVVG
jgi:hypothetical protein